MGDGDEGQNLSPSFFLLGMRDSARPLSRLLAHLPALSVPRESCVPILSTLCLSSVGACGGAWSVVPSCGAMRLVAHRSFPVSVDGLLAYVSRLGAQCGRWIACLCVARLG